MRAVDRGGNHRLEDISALARVHGLVLRRSTFIDSGHLGVNRRAGSGLAMHHSVQPAPAAPGAMNACVSSI